MSDKLNWQKTIEEFRVARGRRYYAIKEAILSTYGEQWIETYHDYMAIQPYDNPSIADMCHLFALTGLPWNRMKVWWDYLEDKQVIPYGAYDRLKRRGFKVSAAMTELGYDE